MRKKCPYCGNNPVPHFLNWYFESINVLLAPVRGWVLYNPFSVAVGNFLTSKNVGTHFLQSLKSIGIIKLQPDKTKCKISRAEVLWEEAEARNIQFSEMLLFGNSIDEYMAEKNGKVITFSGLPRPHANNSTLDILDDKLEFKRIIQHAGLPTPAGGSARTFSQAKKIFHTIQKPVIVKPRAGSRGRHTTTYVYTLEELQKAFFVAKQLCYWVVVEEQLFGPVYRGTVINFKTEGVLRGDSPQVTGDGSSTIFQLVQKRNSAPHPGTANIALDDRAGVYLSRQNLTFESILQKGEVVTLSEKIGVNYGGSSSEDYGICHKDTIELFEKAARALSEQIVGFDFIIGDIAKSWKEQRCGFIEANSLPFINLHHEPLLGTPRNVAAAVWRLAGM